MNSVPLWLIPSEKALTNLYSLSPPMRLCASLPIPIRNGEPRAEARCVFLPVQVVVGLMLRSLAFWEFLSLYRFHRHGSCGSPRPAGKPPLPSRHPLSNFIPIADRVCDTCTRVIFQFPLDSILVATMNLFHETMKILLIGGCPRALARHRSSPPP